MLPTASLTALLVLAVSTVAKPIVVRDSFVTLPFAKHLNVTGAYDLVQKDQARAAAYRQLSADSTVVSIGVTNAAQIYVASIGVGSPPTYYSLLIDTGSSNTWVGAGKAYVKTSTSTKTSNSVYVPYGSGQFRGTEYTDTVTLGTGLVIPKQSIGVASSSSGFSGFDGILGRRLNDNTIKGTLTPATTTTIPTVTDNLYSQGTIPTDLVAVSYEPATSASVSNGELTFGGLDSSKYTGSITYTSITTTYPASNYWGINQSILYGTTSILSSTAGIVDTGTTLTLLATNAYKKYQSATGATLDRTTGLLKITSAQYSSLKSLYFTIGGTKFELTPNAQIWPRSLNSQIGGSSGSIYLIVNDIGSNSGSGLDFINGYTFLERFYSVFDTTDGRVGLATTPYTTATTN
ncbi:acid protease [Artomyces pyxidatus]|uniref:Acid protease n=1 Tax=Artomyces pyxidatus TaxID=48021 RepID=A0ACB8T7Y5_9AGAM|nr:acid protease [Artomyces pyxidatus]